MLSYFSSEYKHLWLLFEVITALTYYNLLQLYSIKGNQQHSKYIQKRQIFTIPTTIT